MVERRTRSRITLSADEEEKFARFWAHYPRHTARLEAIKAWSQVQPTDAELELMLSALMWQRVLPQWLEGDGQFIPHASTWLRGHRWEDERPLPLRQPLSKGMQATVMGTEAALERYRQQQQQQGNGDAPTPGLPDLRPAVQPARDGAARSKPGSERGEG